MDMARPALGGMRELSQKPDAAQVLLVYGEKAETTVRDVLNGAPIAVLSWEIGVPDMAPIAGRKIAVVPPVSGPGCLYAAGPIVSAAMSVSSTVRVLDLSDEPDDWELTDQSWDKPGLLGFLRDHLREPLQAPYDSDYEADRAAVEDIIADQPTAAPEAPVEARPDGAPFQVLGHDHGVYYYMPVGTGQVVQLSPSAHTSANLLQLAPLSWWERNFHGRKGPDWQVATDTMLRRSEERGIFDPARIRGRGAWWDGDRAVLHLGDRISCNGAEYPIDGFPTKYIYEHGSPLAAGSAIPLPAAHSSKLLRIAEMLPWERPVNAKLFAGWIMLAMICGALRWRPHIWITGAKGTGKTWVLSEIASVCLGDLCLQVESATTEAGIRGTLGNDALPVLFDEAEGEDVRAQERVQNVLSLMRAASSSNGGRIIKGTAQGGARSYQIRSCFAFASISVGVKQQSDISRVTVLGLYERRAGAQESFIKLKQAVGETLTPDWILGLHARAVASIANIRRNADIFAIAAARKFGSQRTGDQLGALLAGAWALARDVDVTLDQATAYVNEQDWTEETMQSETRDEVACLAHIVEHMVNTESGDRSIGELIATARDTGDSDSQRSADGILRRYGIRVEFDAVYVSNTHSALNKILERTPWAQNRSRILSRLDGASKSPAMRFGDGSPSARATVLPARYFVSD